VLFVRVRTALHLSQQKLGNLLGYSRRTIIRAEQRGKIVLPQTWETLARACHPRDRALAAELAAAAGHTLVSLGLEAPPAASAPPAAPRPAPSSRHMVDSIVCAAAEAMQTPPHAMRPALTAAFERAIALGMSAEEVLKGMAPARAAKKGDV
jgi:DNA-binding XRE family transcriptional regulator